MDFDNYQKSAKKTAIYPNKGNNLVYPTIGLSGETGELANKVKKVIRDHDGVITKEMKLDISKELGDVLWYVAALAWELGLPLSSIAKENLKKLSSREKREKLGGSGDNR